ncbi:type IX secretion system plug protein [Capnocytophaga canimorsus]|uniref:type IX secretion system plug protein n=1 Tax=Capnocytophaga canimorsus TaxID=28188 RepID=UPI001562920E|nr:DUF5103 domain-containing protein [Capnocytophaga canimorsus]
MKYSFLFLVLLCSIGYAQSPVQEKEPPSHIKTILFSGNEKTHFPIIRLNEPFTLRFDDLNADEAIYRYQITHYNADWQPSSLLKSEYLRGMDDQYIYPSSNSNTTLQPYSHYSIDFPSEHLRILLTGNYLLSVTDQSGNLIFSRKFVVYSPSVGVEVNIKRSRDMRFFDTKQVVQFTIKGQALQIQNPKESVKVTVLQNYRWDTAIHHLKPQYTMGGELIYRYDEQAAFDGGNEFLYFENKDIRTPSSGVYRVEQTESFHHYLFTSISRANRVYTYNPDINGNFIVATIHGENPHDNADYTWVHFSLEGLPEFWSKSVYVYGKFSNYQLSDAYKLSYDESAGVFHGKVLLKQGFYNYNFAVKSADRIDFNGIGGNFQQTENDYTVIVYYRAPGTLYDQAIGVGGASSVNITR